MRNQILVAQIIRNSAFPGADCIEPCIEEMQLVMNNMPFNKINQYGQLSFPQLLQVPFHSKYGII